MKLPLLAVAALAIAPLTACSLTEDNNASSSSNQIKVTSTNDKCEVSAAEAKSGTVSFDVTNGGDKVTEFYLYAEDGLRIVGEVENVSPGISRNLVLTAQPGKYFTACKPGMTGDGIRAGFNVTDSGTDTSIKGVDQKAVDAALTQYDAFIKDQTSQLIPKSQAFVDAYEAGKDDEARALFPVARKHWESIETVAESFGDLDPKTDNREATLSPGEKWTGWHRIEKDLWPPATGYTPLKTAERAFFADDLMKNLKTLATRVANPAACPDSTRKAVVCGVDQIANGSNGLLTEVATGKISGEEDIWSHTDLWDFQGNVDGARVGYETLKPLLDIKDKALSDTLETRFTSLQVLLDQYKDGDGFVFYDTVTEPQRKALSDAVNALSEPLSKMAGVLTL